MQVIRAKVLVDDAGYITLYRPQDDEEIARLKAELAKAEARADKAEAEIRRIHEAVSKRLNDNVAALKADVDRLLRWTKRG